MSRLIRLYPPAWRERYMDEFRELLVARPATWRDQFDVARGAFDAWIHPQVRRPGRAPAPEGRPVSSPPSIGSAS